MLGTLLCARAEQSSTGSAQWSKGEEVIAFFQNRGYPAKMIDSLAEGYVSVQLIGFSETEKISDSSVARRRGCLGEICVHDRVVVTAFGQKAEGRVVGILTDSVAVGFPGQIEAERRRPAELAWPEGYTPIKEFERRLRHKASPTDSSPFKDLQTAEERFKLK